MSGTSRHTDATAAGGGPPPSLAGPAPQRQRADLPTLAVAHLARAFGETQAVRDATVDLHGGEVHAVVGENGSGKSTLVKILAGVLEPDTGDVRIGGHSARFRSPADARAAGVATVFQEILVVDTLSVLDNVWLGADGLARRRVLTAHKRERAAELLRRLAGRPVDLAAPVSDLDLSDRQLVVITRALVQDPKVVVFDESTSALDISARERLFAEIARLRSSGVAVVFISHRMDEIEAVADRVTVLRAGTSVATLSREDASPATLLRLMSSRAAAEARERQTGRTVGDVVLRVRGVRLLAAAPPIDLELRSGEIVGLAGLEGHGQEQFLRFLAAAGPPLPGVVERVRRNTTTRVRSQRDAARLGIAYVPRDRRTEGIFEPLSILDNFGMPTLGDDRVAGVLGARRRSRRFEAYRTRLSVRMGRAGDRITSLSGGNQQKVILARWLAARPDVFVLNDPTRGVDQGTKTDIYQLLDEATSEGMAVVLLSSEVEELVSLVDRALVFHEQRVFIELAGQDITREAVVAAFFGRTAPEERGDD